MSAETPRDDRCPGCLLVEDRRTFLAHAALVAAAALASLGAPPRAFAATARIVAPLGAAGAERSYAIPSEDGVSIDADNEVILARWQGRVYAFSLRCPHRGARLQWRASEGRVVCPRHKARFRPDGAHDSGRSSRDLDRFDLRRQGSSVVVNLAALRRADRDAAAWQAAVIRVA
ncbi:MAG: Rieske (2Fe-2S) protein [Gemmatimonadaceae bacterium]|nr:Rieske (2Fe-2S) protein [Gemmatimonadaceae bacterium]